MKRTFAAGFATLCLTASSWGQQGPREWDFSSGTEIEFGPQGNITRISLNGHPAAGEARLFLHRGDKGGVLYQGWGFVPAKEVKWDRSDKEIKVRGVLLSEKDDPSAPGAAEFAITYKKLTERSLEIDVEITYLSDATWDIPAQFTFNFPVQDFAGAEFVTFDRDKMERSYEVGENELTFDGHGLTAAAMEKDGRSVTIECGKGTVLSVQDARSFGGDYLKVSLAAQQPEWKPPFAFWNGMKQSFRGKLTFKEGRR